MALFLLVWLGCGVATALIAGLKNRSSFQWLLIGLIGGMIALVVIAAMEKLPSTVVVRGQASEGSPATDTRACPHCAETIRAAAKVCRFCQRDVEPLATLPILAVRQGEAEHSFETSTPSDGTNDHATPRILVGALVVGGVVLAATMIRVPDRVASPSTLPSPAPAAAEVPHQKSWAESGNGLAIPTDIDAVKVWCEAPAGADPVRLVAATQTLSREDRVTQTVAKERIVKALGDVGVHIDQVCAEGPRKP